MSGSWVLLFHFLSVLLRHWEWTIRKHHISDVVFNSNFQLDNELVRDFQRDTVKKPPLEVIAHFEVPYPWCLMCFIIEIRLFFFLFNEFLPPKNKKKETSWGKAELFDEKKLDNIQIKNFNFWQ